MSDNQVFVGQSSSSAQGQSQPSALRGSGKTILLCEDDPLLQTMYKTKFEKDGFTVFVAHNGEECVELALSKHPNFLVCDIMLPKLSGLDAISQIRLDSWGKNLPVIILSNLMNQTEKDKAQTLEVKAFLLKSDTTPKQVVDAVYAHLTP